MGEQYYNRKYVTLSVCVWPLSISSGPSVLDIKRMAKDTGQKAKEEITKKETKRLAHVNASNEQFL